MVRYLNVLEWKVVFRLWESIQICWYILDVCKTHPSFLDISINERGGERREDEASYKNVWFTSRHNIVPRNNSNNNHHQQQQQQQKTDTYVNSGLRGVDNEMWFPENCSRLNSLQLLTKKKKNWAFPDRHIAHNFFRFISDEDSNINKQNSHNSLLWSVPLLVILSEHSLFRYYL